MKVGGKRTADRVDAVIGQIYDAAGAADQWPVVIKSLCELVEAKSGVIWFKELASDRVPLFLTYNQDPRAPSLYAQYFHRHDVWFNAAADKPVGYVTNGEDLISWQDLTRTEFYNDFLKHFDCDRIGTVRLVKSDRWISHCSLFRPGRRDSFEDDKLRLLATLTPHLRRAVTLHLRLASIDGEHRIAEATLDAMALGVVVLDRAGHPVFVNRSGQQILQRRDGLQLDHKGLSCLCHTETAQLRQKLQAAAEIVDGHPQNGSLMLVVSRRSATSHYILTIAPLRGAAFDRLGGTGTAAIFIADPDRAPETPHDFFVRLYTLTPAEARLAEALANGATLDDLATRFGVQKVTLRSQLQQVFRKTGTSRQADLAVLVHRDLSPQFRLQI